MPTEGDHIALANRNHAALFKLLEEPAEYSEWIATIAFYKAVQLVEAMFARAGRACHDHRSRHDALKRHHADIWRHYRPLWQASCVARYLHDNDSHSSYKNFADYIAPSDVNNRLVLRRLRPVEQLVVGHLSDPARTSLQRISS